MDHIPKNIRCHLVDDENQRYMTVGDFLYEAETDTLTVYVSRMENWKSELAVLIHEIFESVSLLDAEVPFHEVDLFDFQFEKDRKAGKHTEYEEPGDSADAPYHRQHVGALFVEKETCAQLNLPWAEHERIVDER